VQAAYLSGARWPVRAFLAGCASFPGRAHRSPTGTISQDERQDALGGAGFPRGCRPAVGAGVAPVRSRPRPLCRSDKKQEAEREREHKRLERRRKDYESEQRKQKTALTLDMIQRDRDVPRALRDAAREYVAQQQWVSDLDPTQQTARPISGPCRQPAATGSRQSLECPRTAPR
jgi:hypothetical protein